MCLEGGVIVEVRDYRIKPGQRNEFLEFFTRDAVPLQRSLGMGILGPFPDLENPDRFIWLRSFPSLDHRDAMKRALYDGAAWKGELEGIAMPMLEQYQVILAETTPSFVDALAAGVPTPRK